MKTKITNAVMKQSRAADRPTYVGTSNVNGSIRGYYKCIKIHINKINDIYKKIDVNYINIFYRENDRYKNTSKNYFIGLLVNCQLYKE